jgi:hypothetical protein
MIKIKKIITKGRSKMIIQFFIFFLFLGFFLFLKFGRDRIMLI